jgi:hypothetical protein
VEVTERQVGTVTWSRRSQTKVAMWLTVAAAVWGLASPQDTRTPVSELLAQSRAPFAST